MSIGHFRLWSSLVLSLVLWSNTITSDAAIGSGYLRKIREVNKLGPYLGIVVPNMFEMDPLLHSDRFVPDSRTTSLDIMGRRFRVGKMGHQKVIIVMTGLSMLNAGITTELLLTLFSLEGVLHYGIAGNANPNLQIGDVTIPEYWAHSGLWNWQRFGSGPNNPLALESNGDFTREIGYLRFANYSITPSSDNFLNNVWYQPEEIFTVDGSPEVREHIFKVPVDSRYLEVAKMVEGVTLERCVNSSLCLPRPPAAATVAMGVSAGVFVDNRAYREFLSAKFNATAIDMESAAVALVCHQQRTPFIAIRALSDLAGGGSAVSNEADAFAPLAAENAVRVLLSFIAALSSSSSLAK
ncbi:unnamed protein product [Linum tenue]|uniref:Nucleoside phosphorylase domain-containing protein n=2 Tax=Linum tenue TaxID=586396 RepID=A0AAV0QGH4_9ROSI|nr:unnamed protein product [Linum tenue]